MRDLNQLLLNFEYKQNFKDEDFYVSKSNYFAFNLINSWPKWEKNFLNIHGEKNSGKTHLAKILEKKISKVLLLEARDISQKILEKLDFGEIRIIFNCNNEELIERISKVGRMPLPPYIKRSKEEKNLDRINYQTIFANKIGAVAAPTAGLHFTESIINKIKPSDPESCDDNQKELEKSRDKIKAKREKIDDKIKQFQNQALVVGVKVRVKLANFQSAVRKELKAKNSKQIIVRFSPEIYTIEKVIPVK